MYKVLTAEEVLVILKDYTVEEVIGSPEKRTTNKEATCFLEGIAKDAYGNYFVLNRYHEGDENDYSIWITQDLRDADSGMSERGTLESLDMLPMEVKYEVLNTF